MRNLFFPALIALLTVSCQINVMQPGLDGDAVVPDANARIARKLSIGGPDGKTVYGEERYEYNAGGQLTRLNRLYRNASGQMELYGYDEHKYSGQQLQELTSYSFMQGKPYITSVRRYDYPMADKIIEQTYAVNSKSELTMVTSRLETTLEQGQKARVTYYYLNNQTFAKGQEKVFRYASGRLVAEENLNSNGSAGTVFRYAYKGRSATVDEFMGNRPESISSQSFQYDSRGRLVRSEVTKVNPILCVAFAAGSATVYEYAD